MPHTIHSVEQDMTGRWYARVAVSEDRSEFFKFQSAPTEEEIHAVVDKYLVEEEARRLEEEARLTKEEARLLEEETRLLEELASGNPPE